jgi:hypothetical protein
VKKFSQWLIEQTIPNVLYHHSNPANRQSILNNGLQTKYDQTGDENSIKGIYLTDKPSYTKDTWEVNVKGLEVEEDYSGYSHEIEKYGNWYVVYQNIEPERVKLI